MGYKEVKEEFLFQKVLACYKRQKNGIDDINSFQQQCIIYGVDQTHQNQQLDARVH